MKLENIQHKHTLTNILKVALFSLFLMLPFLNILTKSLYVICNKNAKDSYYGETINEKQNVDIDQNDLLVGQKYIFYTENSTITSGELAYSIDYLMYNNTDYSNYTTLSFFYSNNKCYSALYGNGLNTIYLTFPDNEYTFEFSFTSYVNTNFIGNLNFKYIEYNKYSYLDNVFQYSFDDLENQTWFNWTKNTPLYSGVKDMTTNLGINNNVISMILTYWLILTTIYIIIDIVINLYTLITHIISGKKAS